MESEDPFERHGVDKDSWKYVAGGDESDQLYWEKGFTWIENVHYLLVNMEELPEDETVDWDLLLEGLPALQPIRDMEWPPTYSPSSLEDIDDFFLVFRWDFDGDFPGNASSNVDIFILATELSEARRQFGTLKKRLANYEPLKAILA